MPKRTTTTQSAARAAAKAHRSSTDTAAEDLIAPSPGGDGSEQSAQQQTHDHAPPTAVATTAAAPLPRPPSASTTSASDGPFFAYLLSCIPQTEADKAKNLTQYVGFSHKFAFPVDVTVMGPGPAGGFTGPRLVKLRLPKKKSPANVYSVDAWSLPEGVATDLPPLALITTKNDLVAWINRSPKGFAHVSIKDDPFYSLVNVGVSQFSPEIVAAAYDGAGVRASFRWFSSVGAMFKNTDTAEPRPFTREDFPDTRFDRDLEQPHFERMASYAGSNAVKLSDFVLTFIGRADEKEEPFKDASPTAKVVATKASPVDVGFYLDDRFVDLPMPPITATVIQIQKGGKYTDMLSFKCSTASSAKFGIPETLKVMVYPSQRTFELADPKFDDPMFQLVAKLATMSITEAIGAVEAQYVEAKTISKKRHLPKSDRTEYVRLIRLAPDRSGAETSYANAPAVSGDDDHGDVAADDGCSSISGDSSSSSSDDAFLRNVSAAQRTIKSQATGTIEPVHTPCAGLVGAFDVPTLDGVPLPSGSFKDMHGLTRNLDSSAIVHACYRVQGGGTYLLRTLRVRDHLRPPFKEVPGGVMLTTKSARVILDALHLLWRTRYEGVYTARADTSAIGLSKPPSVHSENPPKSSKESKAATNSTNDDGGSK